MIWRWLLLVPVIVLLSPGLLRAQEDMNSFNPFKPNASNNGTMYEDIEIFRRILDRNLHGLYPREEVIHPPDVSPVLTTVLNLQPIDNPTTHFYTTWLELNSPFLLSPNNVTQYYLDSYLRPAPGSYLTVRNQKVRSTLEGVYLKGQGIVYTATLSSLQAPTNAQTNDWEKGLKLGRPVSEWESVRRQLRNEKEEPKKPEASKPPTLSDVLLKVLAENGHHFSLLGENENLSIVLTVREASPSSSAQPSAKEPKKTAVEAGRAAKMPDLELLGDLHMKQEHYGQASDAFRKAMKLEPDRQKKAALARKLAQAYLMLSNIEEARAALDQALALTKEAADKKDKPASRVKPAAALPVKLIISAPKKLLDQVKEGKITFEEFRTKAHVETLRFDNRR